MKKIIEYIASGLGFTGGLSCNIIDKVGVIDFSILETIFIELIIVLCGVILALLIKSSIGDYNKDGKHNFKDIVDYAKDKVTNITASKKEVPEVKVEPVQVSVEEVKENVKKDACPVDNIKEMLTGDVK